MRRQSWSAVSPTSVWCRSSSLRSARGCCCPCGRPCPHQSAAPNGRTSRLGRRHMAASRRVPAWGCRARRAGDDRPHALHGVARHGGRDDRSPRPGRAAWWSTSLRRRPWGSSPGCRGRRRGRTSRSILLGTALTIVTALCIAAAASCSAAGRGSRDAGIEPQACRRAGGRTAAHVHTPDTRSERCLGRRELESARRAGMVRRAPPAEGYD